MIDPTRIIDDFHPDNTATPKKDGDELTEADVGRIITGYMNREYLCTPEQRDVRKNLLPPDTILTGCYCSGCAAKGDDPDCVCGGRGWRTFDSGFGPYHTGTVDEITHVAKNDWAVNGI